MTLPSTPRRAGPFNGNGSATSFAFTFKVFAEEDIRVVLADVDGVESTLTLDSDYSVTLNGDQVANPGGTITYPISGDPLATGETLTAAGALEYDQPADIPDGGNFNPTALENELDRIVMQVQQLAEENERGIRLALSSVGVSTELPLPQANQVIAWNPAGTALVNRDTPLTTDLVDGTNVEFTHPKTGADEKNVYVNLIQKVPVVNFGLDPDQTPALNTTGLQRLFNSNTRFEAVFGDGDYKFNNLVTIPNGVNGYLTGSGSGATTLFQTDLTKGLLKFDLNYARGAGVRGMSLFGFVPFLNEGSTGIGLQIVKANSAFLVDDVVIERFNKGLRIDGSFYVSLRELIIRSFTDYGIYESGYTGAGTDSIGTRMNNVNVTNLDFAGSRAASVGILCEQASGSYWDTVDVASCNTGIKFKPTATSWVRYLFLSTVLADDNLGNGWEFDGSLGQVVNSELVNCWASFNGGSGMVTVGSGVDDMVWVGGKLRENGVNGWDHQGGQRCFLKGTRVTRNSKAATNTHAGIRVRAGVSNWGLIGVESGNFSTGIVTTEQAEGLKVDAGASTGWRVVGCDFTLPGTGKSPVANGVTNADFTMEANLPRSVAGVNVTRGVEHTGSSGGTVAAGATVYLGCNGAKAVENDTVIVVGQASGVVRQLLVQSEDDPVGAETFTYTVMLNNVATTMTGTITGAAFQAVDDTHAFTVTAGNILSVRLVTSAGAAVTRHRWALAINS
jgi:hypothetical protein